MFPQFTTGSYRPEDLSTAHFCNGSRYEKIDYTMLALGQIGAASLNVSTCTNYYNTNYFIDTVGYAEREVAYIQNPSLSMLPDVMDIDPRWAKCFRRGVNSYDPPTTLRKASALTPGATSNPITTTSARPALPISPPFAHQTTNIHVDYKKMNPNHSGVGQSNNPLSPVLETPSTAQYEGSGNAGAMRSADETPTSPLPNYGPALGHNPQSRMANPDGTALSSGGNEELPHDSIDGSSSEPAQPSVFESRIPTSAFPEGPSPQHARGDAIPHHGGGVLQRPKTGEGYQQAVTSTTDSPYATKHNFNFIGEGPGTGEGLLRNADGPADSLGVQEHTDSPTNSIKTDQPNEQPVNPAAGYLTTPGSHGETNMANGGVSKRPLIDGDPPIRSDCTDQQIHPQPATVGSSSLEGKDPRVRLPSLSKPSDQNVQKDNLPPSNQVEGGRLGDNEFGNSKSDTVHGSEQSAVADDLTVGQGNDSSQISSLEDTIPTRSDVAIVIGTPRVSSANDASILGSTGDPGLHEVSGENVVLGVLTLSPGVHATALGHFVSTASHDDIPEQKLHPVGPSGGLPTLVTERTHPSFHETSNGGLVLEGTTLQPGVQTKYPDHSISIGSGFVAVDGIPYVVAAGPDIAITVQANTPLSYEDSGLGLVLGSTTLPPGADITYLGHTLSAGSRIVAIDGTVYALSVPPSTIVPLLHEASRGGLVVGSTTCQPGAQTMQLGH